jgi:hypothetical protein
MGFAESYFRKHLFLIPQIKEPPPQAGFLFYIVVIPAYLEDNILRTLQSLRNTTLPKGHIEILILFNFPAGDTIENKKICREQYVRVCEWSAENSQPERRFIPLWVPDLPDRHAGAGLARKIGMDAALQRFDRIDNPDGLILSLDADTQVKNTYFGALEKNLYLHPEAGGCIFPFAHPLEGNEFDQDVYAAITCYELHLRYYKHIIEFAGFPYANYTIGSCFGVKADVYARNGGMNRRKAGEDFYFLYKLFPNTAFINISETCVFPSPRPSLRVPFGTGRVIHQLTQNPHEQLHTYNPKAFLPLKQLFEKLPLYYPYNNNQLERLVSHLPPLMQSFLVKQDFKDKLQEIVANTSGLQSFTKRFYSRFDGLMIIKYLNFAHQGTYIKVPVRQAVEEFLKISGNIQTTGNEKELLTMLRKMDGISPSAGNESD